MSLKETILAAIRPQSEPTPTPATLDPESVPPGYVRFKDAGLYRLPHSGSDAASAAAELQHLARVVGTPDDMRRCGVPESIVQTYIPKPPVDAAPAKPKEESTKMGITTQTYDRLQDHDAVPQEPKPAEATKPSTGRSTSPERARVGEIVHFADSTGTCIPMLVMKVLIPDRRPGHESEREHPRVVAIDLRAPSTSPAKTLNWNPSPTIHENPTGVDGYPLEGSFHKLADCPWGR
jgi:hypothetical protein